MAEETTPKYIKHIQLDPTKSDTTYQIRDKDAPHEVIPDSVLVTLFDNN